MVKHDWMLAGDCITVMRVVGDRMNGVVAETPKRLQGPQSLFGVAGRGAGMTSLMDRACPLLSTVAMVRTFNVFFISSHLSL